MRATRHPPRNRRRRLRLEDRGGKADLVLTSERMFESRGRDESRSADMRPAAGEAHRPSTLTCYSPTTSPLRKVYQDGVRGGVSVRAPSVPAGSLFTVRTSLSAW